MLPRMRGRSTIILIQHRTVVEMPGVIKPASKTESTGENENLHDPRRHRDHAERTGRAAEPLLAGIAVVGTGTLAGQRALYPVGTEKEHQGIRGAVEICEHGR